jgi:hypothetical protein
MSDCVCFQDYIAELEVAHDEINRLREALHNTTTLLDMFSTPDDQVTQSALALARAALGEEK